MSSCDSEWATNYEMIRFPGKMEPLLQCLWEDQMKFGDNDTSSCVLSVSCLLNTVSSILPVSFHLKHRTLGSSVSCYHFTDKRNKSGMLNHLPKVRKLLLGGDGVGIPSVWPQSWDHILTTRLIMWLRFLKTVLQGVVIISTRELHGLLRIRIINVC